jgi:hypothetical protein
MIFPNLFLSRNSTYFWQFLCPSSGFFHCTFGTGICHASLMTYIPVPNAQWKTPDDGQRNCPKHVGFLDKNKFGKISASVGFIKKIFLCSVHRLTPLFQLSAETTNVALLKY